MHNIIVVTFDQPTRAYEALTVFKTMDQDQGLVELSGAAVIVRDDDGALRIAAGEDSVLGRGTVGGGLVGVLVGVLGGPVGVAIGLGTGALIGGVADAERADRTDALLSELSRVVPAGGTALFAEVEEFAAQPVDEAMARIGGTVLRRSAEDVLAELEDAEATAQAEDHARRDELRQQRKSERRRQFEDRKERLQTKLHRPTREKQDA